MKRIDTAIEQLETLKKRLSGNLLERLFINSLEIEPILEDLYNYKREMEENNQ